MKYLFLVVSLLFTMLTFAQKDGSDMIIQKFTEYYNNEEFDRIQDLFSEESKKKNPSVKTNTLFKGLYSGIGKITATSYINTDQDSFSHYKTNFEKSVMDLAILSDENNKIGGIKIVPFIEEDSSRNVVNSLDVPSDILSAKQLSLIFEMTKRFPNQTELAIGLIQNGKTNYYGLKIKKDTIHTIKNRGSLFEIGSVSKVFTSTILAGQVQEGHISLNDAINPYFDFPFHNNAEFSFLQLANHSSGLTRLPSNLNLNTVDMQNPYKNYGEKDLKLYLEKEINLNNSLVGKYQYSNLGAGLLGYTLTQKLDLSYEELLQSKILRKYEMDNTTTIKSNISEQLVPGLDPKGEVTPNWDLSVLVGAGGIVSNVQDLTKFINAHFNPANKELQLTIDSTLTVDDKMSIGLGWHLITSENNRNWVWHNGATGGYTSSLAMNPKTKNAVVILSNVSGMNPKKGFIDKLCLELLETIESK